jgi:hypothetical protein
MPLVDLKNHLPIEFFVFFFHALDGLNTEDRTMTDWNSHMVPVPDIDVYGELCVLDNYHASLSKTTLELFYNGPSRRI